MLVLVRDVPRSEHDPDPCPDLEAAAANTAAAAANIAMHPFTGTFADASHETACAAQLFRMAFPCHVFLMALTLALIGWTSLSVPTDQWPLLGVLAFCITLGLVGRVLVHRMHDTLRGQRLGSWTWTALVASVVIIDVISYVERLAQACGPVALQNEWTIQAVGGALVNGSHGLGFGHKLGLMSFMLLDVLLAIAFCEEVALAGEGMLVVGFVVAHLVEMHLRHSYAERVEKEQRLKGEKRRLEERTDEESRRLEERVEQLRAEKERLLYDVQRRGRPLDDGDDRSAIRRGLQGRSQPYQRAASTDSSETRAPDPSDSPPPSMPPGPPSSSDRRSSESGKSGQGTGNSSGAVHGKSTAPPPTWAELDAQFYAETAAELAAEQGMPFGAPSGTAGAPSSQASQSKARASASWAELAYRRFYEGRAVQSSIIEQGVPPPMGQPPTWVELGAEPNGQWHDERAPVVALPASSAPATEATSGQEVVEEMVTEMATQEEGAASTGTLTFEETMAQLQRAIWLADRPSQEVWIARCSARIATDSSSTRPSSQEVPIQINRVTPAIALQQRFDALVMCNFTPRSPRELPKPQWVSYQTLFDLFQPHAETEVWRTGPNNLRQRIIEWYKVHPAFAGLKSSTWCKRLSAVDPQDGSSYVYKFCFQHTPRGEAKGSEP